MNRASKYALDAAKEITVSRMSDTNIVVCKEGGEAVADFFEAIYNKILEVAKDVDD